MSIWRTLFKVYTLNDMMYMKYGYRIDRCTKTQMSERTASINLQASIANFVMPYEYLAMVGQS